MKKLFILLLLMPFISRAQKIALLNTGFKSPIVYTDSVTVQQTTSGLFPVNVNDFDTLYANLDYLNKMLKVRQRAKMKSFELHAGQTEIKISRVPFSNGDRYVIKATTTIGELQSNLYLTDVNQSNKRNSERLEKIMVYMKTNKSLFKAPISIQPKIYNVVIVTD
ncbi:MAG: hypothetical protein ABI295_00785 [Xanthomarina sp.]